MVAVVVMESEDDVMEIVLALRGVGGLAYLLGRGDDQRHQDGDDGDHHEQLDQGEAQFSFSHGSILSYDGELFTSNGCRTAARRARPCGSAGRSWDHRTCR